MTRNEILKKAEECVCGHRQEDYGTPENSFALIAHLWEDYIQVRCVSPRYGVDIEPEDVAIMMALLKIARIGSGNGTDDCYVDLAGYAACGGEVASCRINTKTKESIEKSTPPEGKESEVPGYEKGENA